MQSRPFRLRRALMLFVGILLSGSIMYFGYTQFGSSRSQQLVEAKYHRVLQALGSNDYDKAILLCREIIARDSTFTPTYIKLCQAYRDAKRVDESIAYWDSLRVLHSHNTNIYLGFRPRQIAFDSRFTLDSQLYTVFSTTKQKGDWLLSIGFHRTQ